MNQTDYIRFIITKLRQHRVKQLLGLFITCLYSGVVFLGPLLSQYIVDQVLVAKYYDRFEIVFVGFFFILILQPVLSYLQNHVFIDVSERITIEIREKMYRSILKKSINFFYDNCSGDILSRIINDSRMLSDFISDFFVVIVKNTVLIMCVCVGMCIISIKISFIVAVLLAVSIIIINYISKNIIKLSEERQQSMDELTSTIDDSVKNIISIKTYGLFDKFKSIGKFKIEKNGIYNIKIRDASNLYSATIEGVTVVCIMIIYALGMQGYIKGTISVGNIVGMVLYFELVTGPIISLLNCNLDFKAVKPIIERIKEYTENSEDYGKEITAAIEEKEYKNKIHIKNLGYKYNDKNIIFEKFNLDLKLNGISCLIGKSGIGKTTLSYLILGLITPYEGEIFIDGKNNNASSKKIIYVPQNSKLFNITIKENIRLFDRTINDEEIYSLCKKMNIYDEIMKFKEGFETVISDQINISGGQVQRVLIARALIKNADIIILDEPTSALDKANREVLQKIMKELSINHTFLVITHDEKLMECADEIIKIG